MIRFLTTVCVAALVWTGTQTVAEKPTQPHLSAKSVSASTEITADQAQAAALAHAGLTADQVTGIRTKLDVDDGVKEYDVEFRYDNWEYDYSVCTQTGIIRFADREYDPPEATPAAAESPAAAPTETTAPTGELTKGEAISIALAHAGLKESDVSRLRAEYDRDDGITEWDIEFRVGNMEYEYTIHAESGKILEWDKEYDD